MFKPDTQFFREEFFEFYNQKQENEWGVSDQTLFSCVFKELKNAPQQKFIAVISTIDTHYPYHHSPMSAEKQQLFSSPFLRALHSTDRELGVFVTNIMNDPELYNDRTLIIVTADHSATHGENYTKRTDFTPDRIPLIFITPNKQTFEKLDMQKFASSIDLPPTLLYLIGAQTPVSFMGRSLFSPKNSAVCRIFNNVLLIHTPEKSYSIATQNEPANDQDKVWCDFYYSFYGK
jgi:phosphoglycerol transferase MdoB-like AlkP superfamily enzyme